MTNSPLSGANLRGAVDLSSLVRPAAQSPGTAETPGGVVRQASDESFSAVLELSMTVPVVVEFYGQGIESTLGAIIESFGGKLVLVAVEATLNPQLAQAFQVQQVPTVAAVVAGRPIQLFPGMLAEPELRDVFEQLLQLAASQNVTGSVDIPMSAGDPEEEKEEPLPPHHQEAYDAITVGDFATAIKEYQTAIAQNPRDQLAVAGLAQVSLLARLDGTEAAVIRAAAAAGPEDSAAQLAVADLDVSGGHLEDAFGRLLDLFPVLDASSQNDVRARLLEYFEIAGSDDPRVISARRRLTGLLY
jgi:putative thioredoxin